MTPENIHTLPQVASWNSEEEGGFLDWNSDGMGGFTQFGISNALGGLSLPGIADMSTFLVLICS